MDLRPYQVEAIEKTRAELRHVRRVVIVCPTGGGKTVIAAQIIKAAYAKGKRVLFFAHRRELLKQSMRKLIEAGIPECDVGMMMGMDTVRAYAPVVVASIQTWIRRAPVPADLVFEDECHHATSDSYKKVGAAYAGKVILGLTATPYLANGDGLGDAFDRLVVVCQPRELMEQGFLCGFRVFAGAERPDLSGIRTAMGEFDQAQTEVAMDKRELTGGIVQNWQRLAGGRPTFCFAVSVAHSLHIVEAFNEAGIRAEHIDMDTPAHVRDSVFDRLARGDVQVLSNVGICTEGTDVPAAKCCILARPTKSVGLYLQMAGRVLRPWGGQDAVILDHADNVRRLGFPDADRAFTLAKRPKNRDACAELAKQCSGCGAVVPLAVRACPECGAEFPVKPQELIDARGVGLLTELQRSLTRAEMKKRLCTDKQASALRRAGLRTDVTMAEAGWIIGQLVANRWHASPALKDKFGA
jgi:DNA repair protein RadD